MIKKIIGSIVVIIGLMGAAQAEMTLVSDDIQDGGVLPQAQLYNGFGCEGDNISPHLAWSGAPEGTKSYAVTMYDPDAPTGSGWWHWTVFNIPASVNGLVTDVANAPIRPETTRFGRNDYGQALYGGACPPEGDDPHRYIFTVYALDVEEIPLDETASGAMVGFFVRSHALDQAEIEVTYGR